MIKTFKKRSVFLVILLSSLPLVIACQDKSGSADQELDCMVRAQVNNVNVPGIMNFSRLENTAGFGGITLPSAMARLKNDGFSSVINLRLMKEAYAEVEASRTAAQAAELKYTHLPFDAANPDPQLVPDFLAAVGDKANQPVYIHCNSATRAAGLWMIKRVFKDGWEIDEAGKEAEMIAFKPSSAIAFATNYIKSHRK